MFHDPTVQKELVPSPIQHLSSYDTSRQTSATITVYILIVQPIATYAVYAKVDVNCVN